MDSQLLRRIKSTIPATRFSGRQQNPHTSSNKTSSSAASSKRSCIDLSSAVESPLSISNRASFYNDHPPFPTSNHISQFTRRLARKASTLSLRSKGRTGGRFKNNSTPPLPPPPSPLATSKELFTDPEKTTVYQRPPTAVLFDTQPAYPYQQDPTFAPQVQKPSPTPSNGSNSEGSTPTQRNFSRPALPEPTTVAPPEVRVTSDESRCSWKKMASESAPPPVPYVRLQEIAKEVSPSRISQSLAYPIPFLHNISITLPSPPPSPPDTDQACTTILGPQTSYNHDLTESWNTSIINAIIASLISATTSPTQSPAWKFVVNSVIVQHRHHDHSTTSTATSKPEGVDPAGNTDSLTADMAATSVTETSSSTELAKHGRRGMHAAQGAYWNVEKDGMWSYKYEAAETKGLDVVIGIVWISIGADDGGAATAAAA